MLAPSEAKALRTHLDGTLFVLRDDRYSWWVHWAELARYILPRRYRWLVQPQQQLARGQDINQYIIDSTGTIAARVLAAGMMSGNTSPTRRWFNLQIEGYESADESDPVAVWLAEVRDRMMRVFQESNFYNAAAIVYMDLAIFGTAPVIIHEDFENVIHCSNPCAGEYYVANNDKFEVGTLYREFSMSMKAIVAWFGIENVSKQVSDAFNRGGAEANREIVVCHAIEPNQSMEACPKVVAEKFQYREVYWEKDTQSGDGAKFLRISGYHEAPFACPRWDISGNDAYGRSPGMDALGDIKQLQMETKRKAQVIDKMANPPMLADAELQNKPASTLPGGVTYLAKKDGVGFKPAYELSRAPIAELTADIQDVRERIRQIFFNDLFLMFQQLEAEPRSATAIDARKEEKMIMLGPVLERLQTEFHDKVIDRTFAIMMRGGLLPEAPEEIAGRQIQVVYESMLAAAQKAVETTGIERLVQFVGSIAGARSEVLNKPDWEKMIEKYSGLLGNDPRLLVSSEAYQKMVEGEAQQKQQAYLTSLGQGGATAAKTLSETDVGGGQNALAAMLGNQSVQ